MSFFLFFLFDIWFPRIFCPWSACVHVLISVLLSFSFFWVMSCLSCPVCLSLTQFLFLSCFYVHQPWSVFPFLYSPQFFPFTFWFSPFTSCDIKLKHIIWFVKVTLNVHEYSDFYLFQISPPLFPFFNGLHNFSLPWGSVYQCKLKRLPISDLGV